MNTSSPIRRGLRRIHRLILPLGALAALGCYEHGPVGPQDNLSASVPRGSVQMILQQESSSGDELTLVARVVSNGVNVGAYQGALTFVPGSLELVGITTPTANGELYLVNPAGFADGRIRFAAYTTADAFSGTEAFRLRVKALRPIAEAGLTGHIDVAGEPSGVVVAKTKLLASRGIREAASNRLIVP